MERSSNYNLFENIERDPSNILSQYVQYIEENFTVNINIHDVIGVRSLAPSLEKVFRSHQYHNNGFCNFVKRSCHTLELCVLNKEKLCRRCQKEPTPFYDRCYMGVEEFVYPVLCDHKLIAILCIGQFYINLKQSTEFLENSAVMHRLSPEETEKHFLSTVKPINFSLEKLNCAVFMLTEHIALTVKAAIAARCSLSKNDSLDTLLETHKDNFILTNTLQFIKDHYFEPLTLKLLASNSYCNETYLSHVFKKKMQQSVTEYINSIRIQQSKELLDLTSRPITEICMMVGFNDPGYFGRVFKSIIGITPKEYRERTL